MLAAMEERTLQLQPKPNEPAESHITNTEAPSPPRRAPSDGHAPAPFFSDDDDESGEEGGEFEFEFPFVSRDSPAGTAAPADELFAGGRIRPFYPVFGHGAFLGGSTAVQPAAPAPATAPPRVRGQLGRLFLEESREHNASVSSTSSSSSTEDDDVGGGAPPESYCLWTPAGSAGSSPRPPRKSSSTGSVARWRRISELVVGRSHSDGKEKFMFFPAPQPKPKPKEQAAAINNTKVHHHHDKPKPKPSLASGVRQKAVPAEVDAAAHRLAYGGVPGGTPRRTFLPYREELVGFFANVNGISRSHQHPF